MKTLVSVIVPFYNEELYLKSCLNSLLQQSYQSCEAVSYTHLDVYKRQVHFSRVEVSMLDLTLKSGTGQKQL